MFLMTASSCSSSFGFTSPIPSDFNAFVYLLEGEAGFGANPDRAWAAQAHSCSDVALG
jgi:hypothetical protein